VNRTRLSAELANVSPVSAFLTVPAPSPIVTSAFTISRASFHLTPPTPSPLVTNDLLSLFSLGSGVAKRLFKGYRIDEENSEGLSDFDGRSKLSPQSGLDLRVSPRSGHSGKPLGSWNAVDPETNGFSVPSGVRLCQIATNC
jgi:hypothetical protein